MIQYIALAMSASAASSASKAREVADQALHDSKSDAQLVIVRPVDLHWIPNGKPVEKLIFGLFSWVPKKQVINLKPWGTFSIKKSDIVNCQEHEDEDGTKYCRLEISPYAKIKKKNSDGHFETQIGIYIPGSIEDVTNALGGN